MNFRHARPDLTYRLVGDVPGGAAIAAAAGIFTWTPSEAQGPGAYTIMVRIGDSGSPARSDTKQFTVGKWPADKTVFGV
jgi:hypothetical protein